MRWTWIDTGIVLPAIAAGILLGLAAHIFGVV